jgi:hypothetical protein
MSFDIGGIGSGQGPQRLVPMAAAKAAGARASTSTPAADTAVDVQTLPQGPPPAVMDAISAAAAAYQQLHDSGHHLHFSMDPGTGRVSAELQDLEGNTLGALAPSQVLAFATGAPV